MKLNVLAILVLVFGLGFLAPVNAQINPNVEAGLKPYGSYDSTDFDTVSLTNGNLFVHIPLIGYPQRGSLVWQTYIVYNGKNFYTGVPCNTQTDTCTAHWVWGNQRVAGTPGVYLINRSDVQVRYQFVSPQNWATVYTWDGSAHQMAHSRSDGSQVPLDGSGMRIDGSDFIQDGSGNQVGLEDTNGNEFVGPSGDTMGRSLPDANSGNSTGDYTGCTGSLPTTSANLTDYPGYNGGTLQVKTCYASGTLKTDFSSRVTDPYGTRDLAQEFQGTEQFLQTVIIYDGNSWSTSPAWSFTFDAGVPGDTNIHYGDLLSVSLPTGGTVSYAWETSFACGSQLSPASRSISSRTVDAHDGLGPQTTTYGGGVQTDPLGNDTVHLITGLNNSCSYYETETDYYQGSHTQGRLLKKVLTTYQSQPDFFDAIGDGTSTATNVFPTDITTTWANNQQSKVHFSYDTLLAANVPANNLGATSNVTMSYGKKLQEQEYDYGNGSPGPLLKRIDYTYAAFEDPRYLAANMLDRMSSETTYDGGGTQWAATTYGYDESGVVTTSAPQHTSPPYSVRGNRTSMKRWLNTIGGTVNTTMTYYDTGMPYQVTDPNGNVTTYAYSSDYDGAYRTLTQSPATNGIQHNVSATYDFNSGKVATFTDENQQQSRYGYDALWRATSADYPDNGHTGISYPDLNDINVSEKISSSMSRSSYLVFDGLGRELRHATTSGESLGYDENDTCYDGDGRVSFRSYPFQDSGPFASPHSCGSPAAGDSFYYDGLNRTCLMVPADGSAPSGDPCATQPANTVFTSYVGPCSTVTDEQGKTRQSCLDGAARLSQVIENPGTGAFNYTTTYSYNPLDNLTAVVQNNSRNRSFIYDSLGRLISSTNPESNWSAASQSYVPTTYSYDANGNLTSKSEPAQNQQGTAKVTLSYCYDALNRMTAKGYSQQTCSSGQLPSPIATYAFDGSSLPSGCSVGSFNYGLAIGKRTAMCDQAGSEAWSYNIVAGVGWQTLQQRTTNGVTKTGVYQDDLLGSSLSIQYPSGRTISYTPNLADRPISAVDNSTNVPYAQNAHYWANGTLCWTQFGSGVTAAETFNSRQQPLEIQATTLSISYSGGCPGLGQSGNVLDLNYNFSFGAGNNGNVTSISNNVHPTRSQAFSYDALNRLSSAQTTSTYQTGPSDCWSESYFYDNQTTSGGAWGNLTSISIPQTGPYVGCSEESGLSVSVSPQNQISSGAYDSAGNLSSIAGGSTYTFDAENHLTSSTTGVNYSYDGDGNRVMKSNGTIYWYGVNGDVLDESDASGAITNEYIFFDGRRIARIAP